MARIKITTLSPVHIGSGRDLLKNSEYLFDGKQIALIDEKKVLEVIGVENIKEWVSIINNNKSLLDYLKQRKKNLSLPDIALRIMDVYGTNIEQKRSIKEQLHSAKNLPMMPGSSIKGAIRTAVISHLVEEKTKEVTRIIEQSKREFINKFNRNPRNKDRTWKWSKNDFEITESKILNRFLSETTGMDANKNAFRFLQISDTVFKYNTCVSNVQIMNLYHEKWDIKDRSDQLVEMIVEGCEAESRITLNSSHLEQNKSFGEIRHNTSYFDSIAKLFEIINKHTLFLLQKELDFWNEQKKEDIRFHDNIYSVIDKIEALIEEIKSLDKEKEVILRIGGNSGWDSITGAWIKNNTSLLSDDEWTNLAKMLNKGKEIEYYPKTRKIDEDGDIMGFVKISIV